MNTQKRRPHENGGRDWSDTAIGNDDSHQKLKETGRFPCRASEGGAAQLIPS